MSAPPIVVFFDLETSGRFPDQHEIIQIAAIAVQGTEMIAELELKLQFDMDRAEPEALAMNSYDEVAWQQALRPQDALRRFSQFLSDHATVEKVSRRTGNSYYVAKLAGHNAGDFDMPFINTAFKRFNMFLPADWRALDTLDMADWLVFHQRIDPPSMKLTDLCEYFGQPITDAHDALGDVRGTVFLAHQLMALIGIDSAPAPAPEVAPEPAPEPPPVEPNPPVAEQAPSPAEPEPSPAEPESTDAEKATEPVTDSSPKPAEDALQTTPTIEQPDTWEPPPNPDEDDRQMLLF